MASVLRSPARAARACVVALALLLGLAPIAILAAPTPTSVPGVAADPGAIRRRVEGIKPLSHEVLGFLPYWRLDSGTAGRLRYDHISTIALFGLGIKSDGNIDRNWVGYKEYVGPDAADVTNAAHAAGVRVIPVFQLFDSGSLPKLTAFLNSSTAQSRFIGQALDLMEARVADGASFDFEPVPNAYDDRYAAFISRFRSAMKARFPKAILVNVTSAGASSYLVGLLASRVDQLMVMTYNYRWSGSTVTGAIAPLDNTTRTVKKHVARFTAAAPAAKILMGVPYYGYDWPVTSTVPNARVQANRTNFGGVWSVTYAAARNFLAANPDVVRRYDAVEGSGFFTYRDETKKTWRQVYFEDERSVAAKYDYAIAQGLAGVAIWYLDGDRGYDQMWDALRSKFYDPKHEMTVRGSAFHLARAGGLVTADISQRLANAGTVPEKGILSWVVRDRDGRARVSGSRTVTLYPGRSSHIISKAVIGRSSSLKPGWYTLTVKFRARAGTWSSATFRFRQPY